jgi:hypothetical protein
MQMPIAIPDLPQIGWVGTTLYSGFSIALRKDAKAVYLVKEKDVHRDRTIERSSPHNPSLLP